MATLERIYNVPLRREWLKVPLYRRAKKATTALREFLQKHMKSENVLIQKELNEAVWAHGMRNPPHHVKVQATKDDKGVVRANLVGVKAAATKTETKASSRTGPKVESKPAVSKVEVPAKAEKPKAAQAPDEPKADKPKSEKPAKKEAKKE